MKHKDLQNWRPELRRAVIKVQPEYFGWPVERQERYSLALPEEDRARFEQALLSELFGRTYASSDEAAEAADRLAPDELQLWNETVLPFFGIGENCFFLNEWFRDDRTILDFDTLGAYDEDDFRFQEDARKKDDPSYAGKPYRGSLYLNWARLFVDHKFTYATLSMAAGYLYSQLDNASFTLIEERIPHRYVPGRNHGKTEDDNWQWDMRVDANGEEGILEELQRRTWKYLYERWDALLSNYDQAGGSGVYLIDESKSSENNLHIAFTYDPKVARLKKRPKIMVRKDAFDGLLE